MSLQKQHSTLRKYTYIIRIQSLDFQYTMGSKKSETTSENPIFHYKLCYQNKQFKLKSELKNQHDYEKTFVPLFALMAAAFKLYELHKFVYNLIIMFSRMIQKASWVSIEESFVQKVTWLMSQIYLNSDQGIM